MREYTNTRFFSLPRFAVEVRMQAGAHLQALVVADVPDADALVDSQRDHLKGHKAHVRDVGYAKCEAAPQVRRRKRRGPRGPEASFPLCFDVRRYAFTTNKRKGRRKARGN